MKIILAGGGTGGPTTPLIAVAEELKKLKPETEFLFVGTAAGPEKELVDAAGIKFVSIPAGKLRRYFSLRNITDFFSAFRGYFAAKKIIAEFKPDLIFTAGSFVAVPVGFAARKAGIKILVHQQDARIGLSNKLIAPFADYITTTFEQTSKEFFSGTGFEKQAKVRTEWVGNPVRREFLDTNISGKDFFQLTADLPVLFITGGGTGAQQINEVVQESLPELLKAHQIIHITGRGKGFAFEDPNYHQFEFLTEQYVTAMKLADIVIARAGLSTIAELSALGKVSVIVPMPGSHQEENAMIMKQTNSAVVLNEQEFEPETLARVIVSLKFNQKRCELLSNNIRDLMPHDSALRIAKIILSRYGNK